MTCQPAIAALDKTCRRRGGRVVECAGLENRYGRKTIGGSNPPLSAILCILETPNKYPFYVIVDSYGMRVSVAVCHFEYVCVDKTA